MLNRLRKGLRLGSRWRGFREYAKDLGTVGALRCLIEQRRAARHREGDGVYRLRPRMARRPVLIRRRTSDFDVFAQVFLSRHYDGLELADPRDVQLIVDCGANAGYSAAYFLSRFPQARLIAVEPEPSNAAMLRRNLQPYGDRAQVVEAGIWSRSTGLAIAEAPYRDGKEWSKQVRETRPDEPCDLRGVDLGSLIAGSGFNRISILKMDIEGAEAVVFRENYESWLGKVDAMAIELHDDSMFGRASDVFHQAIADQGFEVSQAFDLTICKRKRPSPSQS